MLWIWPRCREHLVPPHANIECLDGHWSTAQWMHGVSTASGIHRNGTQRCPVCDQVALMDWEVCHRDANWQLRHWRWIPADQKSDVERNGNCTYCIILYISQGHLRLKMFWSRRSRYRCSFAIKQRPAWFWIQIAGGGGCGAHWQIKLERRGEEIHANSLGVPLIWGRATQGCPGRSDHSSMKPRHCSHRRCPPTSCAKKLGHQRLLCKTQWSTQPHKSDDAPHSTVCRSCAKHELSDAIGQTALMTVRATVMFGLRPWKHTSGQDCASIVWTAFQNAGQRMAQSCHITGGWWFFDNMETPKKSTGILTLTQPGVVVVELVVVVVVVVLQGTSCHNVKTHSSIQTDALNAVTMTACRWFREQMSNSSNPERRQCIPSVTKITLTTKAAFHILPISEATQHSEKAKSFPIIPWGKLQSPVATSNQLVQTAAWYLIFHGTIPLVKSSKG